MDGTFFGKIPADRFCIHYALKEQLKQHFIFFHSNARVIRECLVDDGVLYSFGAASKIEF